MHNSSVAAVVLNWNAADETIECVKSLLNSDYQNLKIVIVDNASTDGSVELLRDAFPSIELICNNANSGYAGGNNLGIKWALENNAEYILVLNNDVTVEASMISILVSTLRGSPETGMVTGKVYYKDDPGRIFSGAGKFIWWRCTGVNRGTVLGRFYMHDRECKVNYISWVLFLARADVFRCIGLLDERFFMYFEDLEFSFRALKEFSLAYTPEAVSYHKSGGGTRWSNYSEVYLYYQTRNRLLVFEDKNIIYRLYVLLFTVCITVAKSLVIAFSAYQRRKDIRKRLIALWKGLKDGIYHNLERPNFK